jgi:hypothetical protein
MGLERLKPGRVSAVSSQTRNVSYFQLANEGLNIFNEILPVLNIATPLFSMSVVPLHRIIPAIARKTLPSETPVS